VNIKSSWRLFTNTAFIELPKALHYYEGNKLKPIINIRERIKTGMPVKIEMGYDRQLVTEFEGYVARSPQPTLPMLIECEDEMWQLKRKEVSVSIKDATVRQIVEGAAPGYEVNVLDEFYGDFSLLQTTPAKIFEELRKTAGIYTFFRKGVLTSGKVYSDENIPKVVANYKYGENITDTDLKYVAATDVKIKIYGSSTQSDGTIVRESVGEEGGDIQRNTYPSGWTKEEVKSLLELTYENVKSRGGYDGSLTSFGFPFVVHGQTVRVLDTIYEQRDSMHFVDAVEVKASMSTGYRRTLELGKEVN
jgi:hypothetical protein